MTSIAPRNLWGISAVLFASAMLACTGPALSLPLELKQITTELAARKKAARQGKLPLPGTPELGNLEERLAKRGLPKDAAVLIRIFKAEAELEVWVSRGQNATYALFASYPICYFSGTLGPKQKEGDRQSPEGFYTVATPQAHPNGPRWPKAINIGYPNPFDKMHDRTGSHILIHGGCASIGCFAMTNAVSQEVRTLAVRALDAGQSYVHIHSFPFRMTSANLQRYDDPKWHDFWRNLKEGYDIFERTKQPPRVSVCGTRYRFEETTSLEGANPGPISVCPQTVAQVEELNDINTRSIETPDAKPEPLVTAGLPAQTIKGEASLQQIVPGPLPASGRLVRLESIGRPIGAQVLGPIATCSLPLPSCRKFSALRRHLARGLPHSASMGRLRSYRAHKARGSRQAALKN